MLANLMGRTAQAVKLPEICTKGFPVLTRAAEVSPSVDRGLGVGDEGLAVDGAGAAEEFAMGQVDNLAPERFLLYRLAWRS